MKYRPSCAFSSPRSDTCNTIRKSAAVHSQQRTGFSLPHQSQHQRSLQHKQANCSQRITTTRPQQHNARTSNTAHGQATQRTDKQHSKQAASTSNPANTARERSKSRWHRKGLWIWEGNLTVCHSMTQSDTSCNASAPPRDGHSGRTLLPCGNLRTLLVGNRLKSSWIKSSCNLTKIQLTEILLTKIRLD